MLNIFCLPYKKALQAELAREHMLLGSLGGIAAQLASRVWSQQVRVKRNQCHEVHPSLRQSR
jgi:hypothetical protein